MLKLNLATSIGLLLAATSVVESAKAADDVAKLCTLFTKNNTESWGKCSFWPNIVATTTDVDSIGGPGDYFLRLEDKSNASWLCSGQDAVGATPSPYIGNWSSFQTGSEFCFDVRAFDLYTAPNFKPLVGLRGGSSGQFFAQFRSNTAVAIADGWKHFCAPVYASATVPTSSDGTWSIHDFTGSSAGSALSGTMADNAWSSLLSNVVDIMISADVTPSPTEIVGYDNFCLKKSEGQAILKVCKVAGEGVDIGTPFTFTATPEPQKGNGRIQVPAGPAPGGYCKPVGFYSPGDTIELDEDVPPGMSVADISVVPSANLISSPDLMEGSVKIKLGAGVTEVTYKDEKRTGWIEICKQGPVKGDFTFSVAGYPAPITVPAGACSPALEVQAGEVVVTEMPNSIGYLSMCYTYPADRLLNCNKKAQTATIKVVRGDISSQTIVSFDNHPSGRGGTPAQSQEPVLPDVPKAFFSPAVQQQSMELRMKSGSIDLPETTVQCTPSSAIPGTLVTCTAKVNAPANTDIGGLVSFAEGNRVIARVPVKRDGTASFATPWLGAGKHTISSTHQGDQAFQARPSRPITFEITTRD